jgi:subtilisin-like proprotein convertase family protein
MLTGVRAALARPVSWLLALVLAASFPAHAASFTAVGSFPAAIPNNDTTGVSRTFNVSGATGTLASISVAVGLTHTYAGDVRLRLVAPNGTGFDLVNRIGRTSSGFGDDSEYRTAYTFVDENFVGAGDIWAAAAGVSPGAVIPGGNYRTTGSGSSAATNLLAAFSGLNVAQINGNWSLQAYDLAPGDTGRVTSAVLTLTFAKANQTITFNTQSGQTYSPGGTFNISPVATASSGLAVSYAVSPNTVCTLGSGTTVNIVGAGTCAITASQAGNANYNAAASVTQNVTIAKAAQTLTFPAQTPARRTFVDGGTFSINPVATSASPNSGSAIAYSSLTPLVCTVSGTTVSMLKPGTCTLAADQAGDSNYLDAPQVTQDVVIVPAPTAIPTLSEWGLMLMGLLAAGLGARRLRRL